MKSPSLIKPDSSERAPVYRAKLYVRRILFLLLNDRFHLNTLKKTSFLFLKGL